MRTEEESRRQCIICGAKAETIPYPYGDSQKVLMGDEEPVLEYYLCFHHANDVNAYSITRMIQRRLKIRRWVLKDKEEK